MKKLRDIYYKVILGIFDFMLQPFYKKMTRLFTPNIFGFTKVGFGRIGDGRYVLPLELLHKVKNPLVLSFGVADDISFEVDILNEIPKAKVYCFDPTVEGLPEPNPNITFLKIGLAGTNNPSQNLFDLQTILQRIKVEKPYNILIKMDIEGYEWGFLKNTNLVDLDIDFFTAELHIKTWNNFLDVFTLPYKIISRCRILENLSHDYYVYHTHANNHTYTRFKDFIFPNLVELTFINKKLFVEQLQHEVATLNHKNVSYNEDYQFPFFNK